MIRIFSSVDRHNYGDLFYPIIINKTLSELSNNAKETKIYSFTKADQIGNCGYTVNPITAYLNDPESKNGDLIIGGGDSLRTDKIKLAEHCLTAKQIPKNNSKIIRLKEMILGKKNEANDFIAQYMNYPSPGPFIIDEHQFSQVNTVIFLSCGVPFNIHNCEKECVSRAFNNSSFIYLRDEQSKQKLIEAGVTKEIHVAPDLICTISDFYPHAEYKQKGRKILNDMGLAENKDFLCFQANPTCRDNIDQIVEQLIEISKNRNLEIVLLPLGYCHEDDVILKEINNRAGNKFIYAGIHSIYEMLSIISACNVFIGTSMHGNITAFSYGIPHLIAPINAKKILGFLKICKLNERLKLDSWLSLSTGVDYLDSLEIDYFTSRANIAKDKVYEALSKINTQISERN